MLKKLIYFSKKKFLQFFVNIAINTDYFPTRLFGLHDAQPK